MKLIAIILIINILSSRWIIKKSEFTACNPTDMIKPTNLYKLLKIDFNDACKELENCTKDYLRSRSVCLENFKLFLDLDCESTYGDSNFNGLYRRRIKPLRRYYCKKIASLNYELALKLNEDFFNEFGSKNKIRIKFENSCMQKDLSSGSCDSDQSIFFLYKTDDVVRLENIDGDCLNSSSLFVTCDSTDSQKLKILGNGYQNNNLLSNSSVLYKLDNGSFGFSDTYSLSSAKINVVEVIE